MCSHIHTFPIQNDKKETRKHERTRTRTQAHAHTHAHTQAARTNTHTHASIRTHDTQLPCSRKRRKGGTQIGAELLAGIFSPFISNRSHRDHVCDCGGVDKLCRLNNKPHHLKRGHTLTQNKNTNTNIQTNKHTYVRSRTNKLDTFSYERHKMGAVQEHIHTQLHTRPRIYSSTNIRKCVRTNSAHTHLKNGLSVNGAEYISVQSIGSSFDSIWT